MNSINLKLIYKVNIMTKLQIIADLQKSKLDGVLYVTYGEVDLGTAIDIDSAIADFENMDEDAIGSGVWYVCDMNGNIN